MGEPIPPELVEQMRVQMHRACRLMAYASETYEALKAIVEYCDDPRGSENSESLAMGLARLLPAARTAISKVDAAAQRDMQEVGG